jgi:hypothetical protein
MSTLPKFAALLATLTLAAAPSLHAQAVRLNLGAWSEPVMLDTMRQDHMLRAKPDVVYAAMLQAFADLGIPTGRTDGKAGIIGSERFERVNSLSGAPMSRSFDCGEGALGPYADAFRLEIVVAAWVTPVDGGTRLGLASLASGRDISGVSRRPRGCASTGNIETKLLDRVTKIVGG